MNCEIESRVSSSARQQEQESAAALTPAAAAVGSHFSGIFDRLESRRLDPHLTLYFLHLEYSEHLLALQLDQYPYVAKVRVVQKAPPLPHVKPVKKNQPQTFKF